MFKWSTISANPWFRSFLVAVSVYLIILTYTWQLNRVLASHKWCPIVSEFRKFGPEVLMFNVLPLTILWLPLALIFRSYLTATLSVLCFVTAMVLTNAIKFSLLQVYFVPVDLALVPFFIKMVPELWQLLILPIAGIGVIIAGIVSLHFRQPQWLRLKAREMAFPIMFTSIFLAFFISPSTFTRKLPKRIHEDFVYSNDGQMKRNGFFNGFIRLSLRGIASKLPADYNEDRILSLREKLSITPLIPRTTASSEQPNIVIVMLESVFDPRRLEQVGIRINKDPLKSLRSYFQQQPGLSVPTFGGFTVKTEFEILSAMPVRFFSAAPYATDVSQSFPALPEMLRRQGYHTMAFHPYIGGFWNRETIYRMIGFDRYYNETAGDFAGANRSGQYISDQALVDKMIQETDKSRKDPFFAFVITMSTHTPYTKVSNPSTFHVDYGPSENIVTLEEKNEFANYLQLLSEADQAILNLIEHLNSLERETIVIVFGDHLPALTGVFTKSVFFRDDEITPKYFERKFTTPLIIHSNKKVLRLTGKSVPSSQLTHLVLRSYGLMLSPLSSVLDTILKTSPGFDPNYSDVSQLPLEAQQLYLDEYRLLSQDLVFGKQYLIKQ